MALVATATAIGVAMTVTLTTGLVSDPTSPSIPTGLGSAS